MKNSLENLSHYHDTGEHAINRRLDTYKYMVFEEKNSYWLRKRPDHIIPDDPEGWVMRHFYKLEHFIPEQKNNKLSSHKDESVHFIWDWKEDEIFGGFDNFFSNETSILDLGSGKGVALKEINEQFKDKNIKCVGVDYRYIHKPQHDSKKLVAGDFENLPFKDNSFNRILSVESFPCWLPDKEKTINKYISEITRVSQIGTIWRGTLPSYDIGDEIKFPTDIVIEKFVENGWEVVTSTNSFIAKLVFETNR